MSGMPAQGDGLLCKQSALHQDPLRHLPLKYPRLIARYSSCHNLPATKGHVSEAGTTVYLSMRTLLQEYVYQTKATPGPRHSADVAQQLLLVV